MQLLDKHGECQWRTTCWEKTKGGGGNNPGATVKAKTVTASIMAVSFCII